MNKITTTLIGSALALIGVCGFTLGRKTAPTPEPSDPIVVTETIVERDTLTEFVPMPKYITKTDTILVSVPVTEYKVIHDTTYISLPRESRRYESENYVADISGYEPRLDAISVFPEKVTTYVTQTPPPIHWMLQAGTSFMDYGDAHLTISPALNLIWMPTERWSFNVLAGYDFSKNLGNSYTIGGGVSYTIFAR